MLVLENTCALAGNASSNQILNGMPTVNILLAMLPEFLPSKMYWRSVFHFTVNRSAAFVGAVISATAWIQDCNETKLN